MYLHLSSNLAYSLSRTAATVALLSITAIPVALAAETSATEHSTAARAEAVDAPSPAAAALPAEEESRSSVPAYLAAESVAENPLGDAALPSGMLPVEGNRADGRISRSVKPGTPYVALTTKQKAKFQLLSTFQPSTLARISVTAGLATLRDSPNEWPRTIETYNWRFADRVGQRLIFKSTEFMVGSVLLKEDPRYFLAENPGTVAKLKSALKQTWMSRRDNGTWAPAWGSFAGAYATGYVSAQWMPESRQTAESILIRSSTQIGFRFCNNLLREFGPTLKKKFRR